MEGERERQTDRDKERGRERGRERKRESASIVIQPHFLSLVSTTLYKLSTTIELAGTFNDIILCTHHITQ